MLICKTITENYLFFQLISFIVDFFILYVFFKRYIKNEIAFGFLFFVLFYGMSIEFNLLRNAKAIMIFLLSLKYIKEKKIIKYLMLNMLGSFFHISALFYLPVYFIVNRQFSRKMLVVIFVIGNCIYIFQMHWIESILTSISTWFPTRLGILLSIYLSKNQEYGITVGYVERFATFILVFLISKKLCAKEKGNLIFINIFYFYSFIFLYFSEISMFLERIVLLFAFP
jgi:hypothetical protein